MRKHGFDLFSLVAGVLFTGIAVLYLVAAATDHEVAGHLVVPVAVVTLMAAGLGGAVVAMARRGRGR
ncbi:hypothetical protein ACGFX4_05640 [Kitasatospora sp. NPDC048365]|uniref:hypothetical protein n=1 Tax=Kitasatospora sp. NPDC048365 TaxID=3364050 RepID=UPI0037212C8A